jgi:chromosomal replication initiator protein
MPSPKLILQNEKLWKSVVGELELSVPSAYFRMFFPKTKIIDINEEAKLIYIKCPGNASKVNLETTYYNQIRDIIESRVGKKYNLEFIIEDNEGSEPSTPLFNANSISENEIRATSTGKTPIENSTVNQHIGLVSDYTFDKFIVGPSNNLAYTVANTIAENPGKSYNPFLIYSNVGLGKTHLLQAIGNHIAKTKPHLKILYCTGQDYLNELMEELQTYRSKGGTLSRFKNKFTSVDVLLIDDVQHIAGRTQTQEEFYFAFNALIMNKKQVVLSTDKHPSEIAKLEDRISSRFNMGMIADMQMPDIEVRNAILRRKRDEMNVQISNEAIDFIAEHINTNIRELEGAFIQTVTLAASQQKQADTETARMALSKSVVEHSEKNVRPTKVVQCVSKYYNLEIREIKGKKRTKNIVLPRHVTMYLLKEINQLPLVDIGQILGGRDHTTIMHGCEKIQKEIENGNFKLKREVSDIKELIVQR